MKIEKLKKVLIALDHDPTAQKVAEAGFSLAKTLRAEVLLLNVISGPANYSSSKPFTVMGFAGQIDNDLLAADNNDELKKKSQQYLDKSKHHLGDKTIQTIIAEGDPAESVLMTAKNIQADIVVMGSNSGSRLESLVMGSVTEKVLRHISIPLFIIPIKKAKQN